MHPKLRTHERTHTGLLTETNDMEPQQATRDTKTHTHTNTRHTHVCTHACTYARTHARTRTRTHTHARTHARTHGCTTHARTHDARTHVCTQARMHARMHARTHARTRTDLRTATTYWCWSRDGTSPAVAPAFATNIELVAHTQRTHTTPTHAHACTRWRVQQSQ
jgi:hypothetical protein